MTDDALDERVDDAADDPIERVPMTVYVAVDEPINQVYDFANLTVGPDDWRWHLARVFRALARNLDDGGSHDRWNEDDTVSHGDEPPV